MNTHLRRGLAVLASASALAAGVLALTAPGASGAGSASWPAADGKLAWVFSTGYVSVGSNSTFLFKDGKQPSWSPDGSRVAYVQSGSGLIMTRRYTGNAYVKFREESGIGAASNPTYWYHGSSVVYSASGRLRIAPSDGSLVGRALFTTAEDGCDGQPSGAINGLLAFTRTGDTCASAGTSAVWLYNAEADAFKRLATSAEHPAISPDATKVAFVRSVSGVKQLFTIGVDGTELTQVTHGTEAVSTPSWSGSGTKIAYNTTVSGTSYTRVLNLATSEVTTPAYSKGTRDAAWQPQRHNSTSRVWGADSNGTNIAGSKWTWNTVGQHIPGLYDAKAAVLINADSPSYALTAAALGGKKWGPVLGTPSGSLSSATQTELKRMLKPGATVYLVGNTDILSSSVASKVASLGYTAKRLSGTSRYSTSVAVAKSITSAPEYVFIATGSDYHSALAASSAAGGLGTGGKAVVVLNDGNTLTSSVKAYLNGLDPDETMMIPVGESAAYALTHTSFSQWPSRWTYYPVKGEGHDGTAVALAKIWWRAPSIAVLANIDSWRGGVTASSAMSTFAPLLWTTDDELSYMSQNYLIDQAAGVNSVTAFGGSTSVSATALETAGSAISASRSLIDYHPYQNGEIPSTSALSAGPRPLTNGTGIDRGYGKAVDTPAPDLDALKTTNTP
ncbi:LpqB family beta-propeller domain-containing protein [Streptomyces sp. NPDC060027]|uniref:LpqB family beta-propeller domain-containing protein n=1 Tax=Streptomyces sp. NPDC060027 TaxID=3347040 RepID=UPI003688208B